MICYDEYAQAGLCETNDIGEFILSANATDKSKNIIFTQAVHLNDSEPYHYDIKNTGYYCVLTSGLTATKYEAVVEFRNAYGELPATQIPKLPFYGAITLLYFFVVAYWGFLYYQYHTDICMAPYPGSSDGSVTDSACSGGSKLHNSDPDLPRYRNVDDLGLLWYVRLTCCGD